MQINTLDEMNWCQVNAYLNRRDVAVIPVGVLEARGRAWTIGYEYDVPLAFSRLYAELADAIVIPHVAHTFSGAPRSLTGTTSLSVVESTDFLKKVANSVVEMGFRRLVVISRHGAAKLHCMAFVRDFFEETGLLPIYLDLLVEPLRSVELPKEQRRLSEDIFWASQKILKSGEVIQAILEAATKAAEMPTQDQEIQTRKERFAGGGSLDRRFYYHGYFDFNVAEAYDTPVIARTMEDVNELAKNGMRVFDTWLEMVKPMESVECLAMLIEGYHNDLTPRLEFIRQRYWIQPSIRV